jgi:hypothetical protein
MKRFITFAMAVAAAIPAYAGTIIINLGTASQFGLLGGTISNTGTSAITGDVGGTVTVTGFTPGPGNLSAPGTATGTVYDGGSTAAAAYTDFLNAFAAANLLTPTQSVTGGDLGAAGSFTFDANTVYSLPSGESTGTGLTLTFDAEGNPNAVFVLIAPDSLTVNGPTTFNLINDANPANIFWIIGTDATISANDGGTFDGNILAGDTFTMSASSPTGTIDGCVFAENANTLASTTDVDGCSGYTANGVPEPGSMILVSLACVLGIWRLRSLRLRRHPVS